MRRTNIYLDEAQSATLDQVARAQGVSRAELIRRLIDQGFTSEGGADLTADLAAIQDSFGVLGGEDITFSRERDERARYLERMAGQ